MDIVPQETFTFTFFEKGSGGGRGAEEAREAATALPGSASASSASGFHEQHTATLPQHHFQVFKHGWMLELELRSLVCVTGTLPTKPSLQPID